MNISSDPNHFRWSLSHWMDEKTMECSFFSFRRPDSTINCPKNTWEARLNDSFGNLTTQLTNERPRQGWLKWWSLSWTLVSCECTHHASTRLFFFPWQHKRSSKARRRSTNQSYIRGIGGIGLEQLHMSGSTLKVTPRVGVATTHLSIPFVGFFF